MVITMTTVVKNSIVAANLENLIKPLAYFDFKVNDELYKDKNMAYCFVIFRYKNDNSIRVGICRFNWRTKYIHSLIPLPMTNIEEFIDAIRRAYELRDEVIEKMKVEKIKKEIEEKIKDLPKEKVKEILKEIEKKIK